MNPEVLGGRETRAIDSREEMPSLLRLPQEVAQSLNK